MLSKTSEYALRAVAVIAEDGNEHLVLARGIAAKGHIPIRYLSKVLRDLVRAGVLSSTRGLNGGFRLRRRADKIKLIDVVKPFEDVLAQRRCPFGNLRCSDAHPCSMHHRWKPVKEAFQNMMEETTVADIVGEDQ